MLGHPALVLALEGSDAQSKALLAQQNVSAVAGVHGDDRIVLREVADVALLSVDLALAVQAAHPVVAVAQSLPDLLAHAGHDGHVQHNIDGVGQLHASLGEMGADRAHGVGDDIHRAALVAALCDVIQHLVRLLGIHPVVGRAGVLLLLGADEGSVLHTGNVVDGGAVQVAARQLLLVELNHLAGGAGLLAQLLQLSLFARNPHDVIGGYELFHVFNPV